MPSLRFDTTVIFDPKCHDPKPSDGDTLLRVRMAGICSTDLEIVRGYMQFHGVLGHEFVADVVSSPDRSLLGKRVVGEINVVCGSCDLCRAGLSSHCRSRSVLGVMNHDGAFADFVRLPAANLHVLPDAVEDERAVFVEPLAAALQVVQQLGRGDTHRYTTVLGDGRLGLLTAQVLRNAGYAVRLIGKHADKLALCEKWQIRARPLADIKPRRDQDVVVDCTGSPSGLELAMQLIRPRGTIVLKSTFAAGKPINLAPLVIDEVTLLGSRCGPFRAAIAALAANEVDVVSLITRRMRLEHGVEAMAVAAKPGVMKVLLTIGG